MRPCFAFCKKNNDSEELEIPEELPEWLQDNTLPIPNNEAFATLAENYAC